VAAAALPVGMRLLLPRVGKDGTEDSLLCSPLRQDALSCAARLTTAPAAGG